MPRSARLILMRRALLAVLALLLLGAGSVGAAPCAWACSCARGTLAEHVEGADAVVLAEVVDVDEPGGDSSTGALVTYTLEVREALAGTVEERLEVRSAISSASCGYPMAKGEEHVLFLSDGGELGWHTQLCDGNERASDAFVAEVTAAAPGGTVTPSPSRPDDAASDDAVVVPWYRDGLVLGALAVGASLVTGLALIALLRRR